VGPTASLDGCGKFRPCRDLIPGTPYRAEVKNNWKCSSSAASGVCGVQRNNCTLCKQLSGIAIIRGIGHD
jgi:hypothetical protein